MLEMRLSFLAGLQLDCQLDCMFLLSFINFDVETEAASDVFRAHSKIVLNFSVLFYFSATGLA